MSDLSETDLVAISEREVIEAARGLASVWKRQAVAEIPKAQDDLAAAVSLLESREQIRKQFEAKNESKDENGNDIE
jgi:hypothetical protein